MDDVEINVDEFLARIYGNKPPFDCPFDDCSKTFRSYAAIQKHLLQSHKSKELEICEIDIVDDIKTTENKETTGSSFKQTSKIVTDAIQLSYADSRKFVILQNDKKSFRCNISVPLNIALCDDVTVKCPELTKLSPNDCASLIIDENSNDTSMSDLSNMRRTSFKRKRSTLSKHNKKIRKLNCSSNSNHNDDSKHNKSECSSENKLTPHAKLPLPIPVPVFTEDTNFVEFDKETPSDTEGYVRYVEKSAEELNEIVEYDLDEEDLLWLPKCNDYLKSLHKKQKLVKRPLIKNNKKPVIEREVMEYVMDRFEKECHFESISGNSRQNDVDEDAVCDVCLDGTCDNSNVILFCDVCNLAVHQECYGVPYVPEGQWLCRKCLHSPSHSVDCCLCPNKGGAFKQTNDNRWAHVVCALWIPEVMFANLIFLEPIEDIEKIESARWRLTCYLCKQKNVGACIQCHRSNCYTAFHVTCAQQAGLYMKIEQSDKTCGAAGIRKSAFCDVHSPPGYTADVNQAMYANSDEDVSSEKVVKRKKKLKAVRKLLDERRNYSPPLCFPVISPDKLKEIGSNIDVIYKTEFMDRIHSYWKLKRECRSGVPLLRRLVASSKSHLPPLSFENGDTEMISSLKFWQQLRQDLEKARLLSELSRKREKLKRELFRNFMEINELLLHPVFSLLKALIDQLQALDTGKIFAEPVTDIIAPNYSKVIVNPMDFSTMRKKLKLYEYTNVDQIRSDFDLMLDNCRRYNAKNTIYHTAANRLTNESQSILAEYDKQYASVGFDKETGLFSNARIYELVINCDDFDEQFINSLETEIHRKINCSSATITTTTITASASTTNNKDCKNDKPHKKTGVKKSKESHAAPDESYTITTRRRSNESSAVPQDLSNSNEDSKDSHIVTRLKKMPATSSTAIDSISSSLKNGTSFSINADSPSAYCTRVSSTHPDPDSTFDSFEFSKNKHVNNRGSVSSDVSASATERTALDSVYNDSNPLQPDSEMSDDQEYSKDRHLTLSHSLEPLDLVWAKCPGSPWFPGMIINPFMSRDDDVFDNKIPIPIPPESVLDIGRANWQHKFLILFFDKKRTWQWLERNKLEPLGVSEDTDKRMLQSIRRSKNNRPLYRAYRSAIQHLCNVTQEPCPYDNCESGEEIRTPFISRVSKP